MRRLTALVLCSLLLLCLVCPARAASTASKVSLVASVAADGSCQYTVDLQLNLETAVESLYFPIPRNARGVSVNGSYARTSADDDALNVNLSSLVRGVTGTFTIRLQYTLPDLVAYNDLDQLILTLPLLSGFLYPVDVMEFSVNLPGQVTAKPIFSSSYFQQSIEEKLTYTASGTAFAGAVNTQLKDLETLTMTLEVPEELFPQEVTNQWTMGIPDVAMVVIAVIAALYWLVFLRCAPFLRRRCTAPPAGCTAGELSCALTGRGSDLTLAVLSWAQLGYILIHLEDSGRVTLHKRMDMGNERSAYENKIFRSLFGKRRSIDGSGYHYASLCRKVATTPGDIRDLYRRENGNPRLYRMLCAAIAVFGGISLGIGITGGSVLGVLLMAVLAVFGGFSAWLIQDWIKGLHLRDPFALLLAGVMSLLWLLLGAIASRLNVAACVVGAQLLCGLSWAYGGRRTYQGRYIASQILGLRAYLKKFTPQDVKLSCRTDPDFFFTMAPHALALGVGKQFARAFGPRRLSGCPYLTTGMDGHLTASEWMVIMTRAVNSLDARQKRLPLERLLGR